ncbi:MAG TPA: hypothetical protein DCP68_05155 [Ruminococcus sp.]|nr:hypothetical protein [Ruminococcus sp.]
MAGLLSHCITLYSMRSAAKQFRRAVPVGRADSRFAKGAVALTVSAEQTNAAVCGFCNVTAPCCVIVTCWERPVKAFDPARIPLFPPREQPDH